MATSKRRIARFGEREHLSIPIASASALESVVYRKQDIEQENDGQSVTIAERQHKETHFGFCREVREARWEGREARRHTSKAWTLQTMG